MLCSGAASPPCQIYHPQERLKNFLRKKYAWVLKWQSHRLRLPQSCSTLYLSHFPPHFSPVPFPHPSHPHSEECSLCCSLWVISCSTFYSYGPFFPLLKPTLCIYPHGNSTNNFVPYNESLFIEFLLCASWKSLLHVLRK